MCLGPQAPEQNQDGNVEEFRPDENLVSVYNIEIPTMNVFQFTVYTYSNWIVES